MKKKIFLWALYDFANTPLTVALTGLYLAQWIILDNKIADIWYGGTFTAATILLLITSPFWGAWSDKIGKRMPFIVWTTILMFVLVTVLGIIASSSLPVNSKVVLALLIFFLLQYFYQLSLIFYDSLLPQISNTTNRGKISGIGTASGQLGWILGPIILLPFANGVITLFGEPGRSQVFLPAVALFAIFGLPMILWFSETHKQSYSNSHVTIYRHTLDGIKNLFKDEKNVALFLIAFMLISDGLLTATLFFAIFLDQIYQIPDAQKIIVLIVSQLAAITSALLIGKLSDRHGTKKMLLISCVTVIAGFTLVDVFDSRVFLYLFAVLIGTGMGGFYATSRALMVKISPKERVGEYFGFYATFEKFASIIGPLIWGVTTLLLVEQGILKYRVALLLLVGLMAAGTLLLLKVKEKS